MTTVVVLSEYTIGGLLELDAPVLPVRSDGGLVLLGPIFDGSGVCVACAEDARLAALGPEAPRRDPHMRLGGRGTPALTPLVDALVEQMVAVPGDYRDRVVAVRTDLGVVSTHVVRPRDGGCAVCAPLPADSAELAVVEPAAVPVRAGELRGANPLTTLDGLREALFDLRHGPVTGVFRTGHLPLAMMSAELVRDHAVPEAGFGRTDDFEQAERVALFEAAERHSGMRPRRCTTVLEASFASLGEPALDPMRLGQYDPSHVQDPRFRLVPYTPDLRMRWVHGWSYTRSAVVAVPEQVAYWAVHTPPEQRFITETSNGCGLGNSLTEAVLHGLFEVAERDAFLMAWYTQTPLPRLAVPADPVLPHLADRLESLGYELMFFDATNDMGIPVVLTLAAWRGPARDGVPRAFFAAGANPDPVAAMRSAAAEVVVDVESLVDRARAKPEDYQRARLLRLFEEPALVRTMDDHVAVNGLPEALPRHAFLSSSSVGVLPSPPQHTDLQELLSSYVARLGELGLEVIAVDQSDPVVSARLGLYSAKVIVPGTVPMTFGHLYRRTLGLPRLVAGREYSSLALHPHPFP